MADADAAQDNGKTYTVKDSHGKVTQKLKLECGWSQTTTKAGKCVPIVTNGPKLYQGKAQCDALATRLGVRLLSSPPFLHWFRLGDVPLQVCKLTTTTS